MKKTVYSYEFVVEIMIYQRWYQQIEAIYFSGVKN